MTALMAVRDREESIEQAYFFRAFRERVLDGIPSQDVLTRISEELLSTTKLPLAVSYLATEIKLTGLMAPAMTRLAHYFTPFQTFVISRAEEEVGSRFPMEQALLILEREARYFAESPTRAGLFVYQFEAVSRNRLGYLRGLAAMSEDPFYDEPWQEFIATLLAKLGDVDFADLIYVYSEWHVMTKQRTNLDWQPRRAVLFSEKEGKIAWANHGRDPLYLFQALQRQLGYPEVPRPRRADEADARLTILEQKVALLENRIKQLESSEGSRPDLDLSHYSVKPEATAGVPAGWGKK